MSLNRKTLFHSVSYAILSLFMCTQAKATVNVSGSGTTLIVDAAAEAQEATRQYVMGSTTGSPSSPVEQAIGRYIFNVAKDGQTFGNVKMVGNASMSFERYERIESGSGYELNFVRENNLNMTGGSIINEGSGILTLGTGTYTLSNDAKILSQGAPSGASAGEASNIGTMFITGGTFVMGGTSEIGGSYGTGKTSQDNGGRVTIQGGSFSLTDDAAIVQKGIGDITFEGSVSVVSESSQGIVHSGGDGNININAGTYTFSGSGGIIKGQQSTDNSMQGDINIAGGTLTFSDDAKILMRGSTEGLISFTGAAYLIATGTDENPYTAVLHQGTGGIRFAQGTKTDLDNAKVYSTGNADVTINGGTFTLIGNSAIGVTYDPGEGSYTQEAKDISISSGSFAITGTSGIVQEAAGSILFKEASGTQTITSMTVTAGVGTPEGGVGAGIIHTGGAGDIDIKAGGFTFAGKGTGIYKGRSNADEETEGNLLISSAKSSITMTDGSSIIMDVSNKGDIIFTDTKLTMTGASETEFSSVFHYGTGTIQITGTTTVNMNAFSQISSRDKLTVDGGTIKIASGSMLRSEGDMNITSGAFTLNEIGLVIQQGKGDLIIAQNEDTTVALPSFTAESGLAPTLTEMPYIHTGLMHAGTSGDMTISAGTFSFKGEAAGLYKGGLTGSSTLDYASAASTGNLNIAGGTFDFEEDARIVMGVHNTGSINITDGTLNFDGNSSAILALGGQDINFSGGTINLDGNLTVQGHLIISGAADLTSSGIRSLLFENGGSVTFNKNISWGGHMIMDTGSSRFNEDVTISGDFTTGGNVDVQDKTLTVGGTMSMGAGTSYALKMESATLNGKIIADSLVVGSSPDDQVTLAITMQRGAAIKDVVRRFTFIETQNAVDSDQFLISNKRYEFRPGTNCPNDLCYDVEMILGASDVVELAGGSENQADTARAYLDGALFEKGSLIQALTDKLDDLSQHDWDEYKTALGAIAPDPEDAGVNTVAMAQNKVIKAVGQRMGEVVSMMNTGIYGRSGGSNYDYPTTSYYRRTENRPTTVNRPWEKNAKRYGMWAQALYNRTKLSSSGANRSGFDGDTSGVSLGFDTEIAEGLLFGFGYAYTTSDIDSYLRTTRVNGNSGFLYGLYKPKNFFVNAVLSGGQSKIKEEKTVIDTFITDEYKSNFFGAQVMAGYEMGIFTPSAGLRYAYVSNEKHMDSIGQEIKSNNFKTFTGILEGKISEQYFFNKKFRLRPELSAALTYDFVRDGSGATVFLPNDTTYTIEGRKLKKFGAEAGVGATFMVDNYIELSLGYKGEYKKDYTNHSIMAKMRYNF